MLTLIRELAGEIKVLVRTRDDSFLEHYKQAGAFEVIPESQEGALMLVSHLLLNCDIPIGRVIRRMEHERSSQYRFLHGFYWGGKSAGNLETDQQLERLHPVLLHDQAWAVGHRVRISPWRGAHQGDSSRGAQPGSQARAGAGGGRYPGAFRHGRGHGTGRAAPAGGTLGSPCHGIRPLRPLRETAVASRCPAGRGRPRCAGGDPARHGIPA